jgi:Holliday junction resolvasome RuvABC ATP-dependent DNA helicase subunit
MPRPVSRWQGFVGQRPRVRQIRKLIKGAQARGKPCESVVIIAPTGNGKTAFGKAMGAEMGMRLEPIVASRDLAVRDVCAVLAKLKFAQMLFIDEAQSLPKDVQELLYRALDEQKIPMVGENGVDRTRSESIAEFTLILATNEPGCLRTALYNRLLPIAFEPYTDKELKAIAEDAAKEGKLALTGHAAGRLANMSQGRPRNVRNWVKRLPCYFPRVTSFGLEHVQVMFAHEGIDVFGLNPLQRRYLAVLAANPQGACSIERLAAAIELDAGYIKQEIELHLFHRKYAAIHGGRGRVLTDDGRALLKKIKSEPTKDDIEEVEE